MNDFLNKYKELTLSERFTMLGNDLLKYDSKTNTQVKMMFEGFVSDDKGCLSCLCGHVAYMFCNRKIPAFWSSDDGMPSRNGIDIIDEVLFDHEYTLPVWAAKNPEIWGNDNGIAAFRDSEAFGCNPMTITISKIANYFIDVGKRIESKGV